MNSITTSAFILFLSAVPVFASAQVVHAPSVPQPSGNGQLVGLNLQNPTSASIPAHATRFGQVFLKGALSGTSGIAATVNGITVPAQIDIKTKYPDGSAKFGVVTLMAPALAPTTANPTMLSGANPSGTPLSLATMPGYSFAVDITMAGGASGPYHFDAGSLLASALSAGTVSYWRQGPVVTEGRISVPVVSSMRLIFDISKYEDGTYSTDVQFDNDSAMTASGGTLAYTATITENGAVVYVSPPLTHFQYEGWHKVFWTGGDSAVNVQHDIAYLEKTGAIHNYDLAAGSSASLISSYATAMTCGDWSAPFGSPNSSCSRGYPGWNGVTGYMPTTGGRSDIGPVTQNEAVWLITQDSTAANYSLYQADTAGNIPWHFWDVGDTTWLTTDNYPNLWVDVRGGTGTPDNHASTGLTQQVATTTGWIPDTSHMPDLSFIPYLLVGSRYYLDQINAQASWAEMSYWPATSVDAQGELGRNGNPSLPGLVMTHANQVRGAAWSLRNIDEAAWANPTGDPLGAYFTKMENNNFTWLNNNKATWQTISGAPYGYLAWSYQGLPSTTMADWQENYLSSSIGQAAEFGNSAAAQYLAWTDNWISGQFLNQANGFNPHDGCEYRIPFTNASGALYTTWSAIEQAILAAGISNGTGWANSNGDYCELALMDLAEIINSTGSANAKSAYAWLSSSGAPQIASPSVMDEQFRIIPAAGSGTGPGSTSTPSSPLPCINYFQSTIAIFSGFGAAYDLFGSNALVVKATCDKTVPTLDVGRGSQSDYVYKLGYLYQGNTWQPITLTANTNLVSNAWYLAQASAPLPSTIDYTKWNYAAAYMCTWIPPAVSGQAGQWKCGCATTACSTSMWQLQAFKR